MIRLIAVMCVFLVSSSALAFNQTRERNTSGTTWTLCDGETTSGAICDDGTVDRAAVVAGYTKLLFDSSNSSGTDYACDIYAADQDVADSDSSDLSSSGYQINSISLTQNTEAISFADVPFAVVWISCTITTGPVTIKVTGAR